MPAASVLISVALPRRSRASAIAWSRSASSISAIGANSFLLRPSCALSFCGEKTSKLENCATHRRLSCICCRSFVNRPGSTPCHSSTSFSCFPYSFLYVSSRNCIGLCDPDDHSSIAQKSWSETRQAVDESEVRNSRQSE